MSGLDIHYDLGEGHKLLGRRMPDLDLLTANGPRRVFTLLHDARPVLLNFGEPGGFDITPWADRVKLVDAKYDGVWELPVLGAVPAPAAVLIRPDGYVAWVGDVTEPGLADALTTWFGPPAAGNRKGFQWSRWMQARSGSIDGVDRKHDISGTVDPGHRSGARYGRAAKHRSRRRAFRRDVVHWLTNGTRDERFIDNIFAEMCVRLQQAGIPVKRATLHLLIHHPQWLGARIMWADGMREAEIARVDYDVRERSEYIGSPANEIHDGATEVRENLERDPSLGRKHAVYDEMRAKGLTDYVAWPLYHTLGKRHLVTFATDRPGGFDDAHIAGLLKLLPVLALVSEIRMKNRLARTLLETYVGSHASELILAGATRRGSGTTVRAAIMICDLRDFTKISDNWPRDDVIDLLNGYFDAMSEPIARHGGEILKFIGDGLLAIFPLSEPRPAQICCMP